MRKFCRVFQAVIFFVLLAIGFLAGADESKISPSLEFRKYSFDTLSRLWTDTVDPPTEAALNAYGVLADDPLRLKIPEKIDQLILFERNLGAIDQREIALRLYLNPEEFYEAPRVKEEMSEMERRELESGNDRNIHRLEDQRLAARVELSLINHLGALRINGPVSDRELCRQRTEAVVENHAIVDRLLGVSSTSGNTQEATDQRNRVIKHRLAGLDQQTSSGWTELSDYYSTVSSVVDAANLIEKLSCSELVQGVTRQKIEQLMDEKILGTVLKEMKGSREALSAQAKPLRKLRGGVSVDPLSAELFELEQKFTNARSNLEFIDEDLLGLESGTEPVLPKLQALDFQKHTKELIGEGKPKKKHPDISAVHKKISEVDASILDLFNTLATVSEVIDGARCAEQCQNPAKTFVKSLSEGEDSLKTQNQLDLEITSCVELVEQEMATYNSSTSLHSRAGVFASHLEVLSAKVYYLLEGGR